MIRYKIVTFSKDQFEKEDVISKYDLLRKFAIDVIKSLSDEELKERFTYTITNPFNEPDKRVTFGHKNGVSNADEETMDMLRNRGLVEVLFQTTYIL